MKSACIKIKVHLSAFDLDIFDHAEMSTSAKRGIIKTDKLLKQFEKGKLYCFPTYLRLKKEEKVKTKYV